jgi:peptide alpha-N-acetyltransferase
MARLAVKKDINSHITWHVLGILAKVRRDWDEAAKAFAMARRQDPDNIPVLRDAIALTTHTRQYQQSLDIRHHYLLLRPQIRGSWLGLMVAHELAGDIEEAVRVYDGFQSMVQKDGSTGPEKAQVLMHVIGLCMQSRHYENALERMEKGLKEGVISSRGEITQMKGTLLAFL